MNKSTFPIIDIKKYGGKQVAIVDGKIVASGKNTKEVLDAAREHTRRANWEDILLVSVPKNLKVIYSIFLARLSLVSGLIN